MSATGLCRGRIKNPLEILLDDLRYVQRDVKTLGPINEMGVLKNLNHSVSCFIKAIEGALSVQKP